MSKKEKQFQEHKEELSADELKGVNGAGNITLDQEQLNAELEAQSANDALMGF